MLVPAERLYFTWEKSFIRGSVLRVRKEWKAKPVWDEAADTISCPVQGTGTDIEGLALEVGVTTMGCGQAPWSHPALIEEAGLGNQVCSSLRRHWYEVWRR